MMGGNNPCKQHYKGDIVSTHSQKENDAVQKYCLGYN